MDLVLLLEENGNQIDIFLADKLCAVFFTPGDGMYRSARIRLLTNIMLESAFKNGSLCSRRRS
jgi:hypothetical protein